MKLYRRILQFFSSIHSEEDIPTTQDIIQILGNQHIRACLKSTLAVINPSFLERVPQGSKFGWVRQFLFNLIAFAIHMHLEVERLKITKDQAIAYVYALDSYTDFDAWVPPINPFVGPAGARSSRKAMPLPARVFKFVTDKGSEVELEMGQP